MVAAPAQSAPFKRGEPLPLTPKSGQGFKLVDPTKNGAAAANGPKVRPLLPANV